MDALVRNDSGTFRMLDYEPEMHPIGGQLCGSKPHLAGPCAKIIENLGFDVVDLNCGCPVDKVTKDGSGSGLLKNPQLIGEIVSNMVAAVKIPVTVKIRTGWDEQHIVAEQITQIVEQAGAKAICIHGRTRAQAYTGKANWDHIKRCKQVAKTIAVIGNGDLFDPLSVQNIFEHTGCDAVLIARGTMGQPWITEDIPYFLEHGILPERTDAFCLKELLIHLDHIMSYQVGPKVVTDFRRVCCWYLKSMPHVRSLREFINTTKCAVTIRATIEERLQQLSSCVDLRNAPVT